MEKISEKLMKKCGIYLIFNLVSGKRYVGSSINIYNRFHEHIHILKRNEAHNKHLQNSWNKYGEESFVFQVLEYCEPKVQFEREQYYIDLIKPEYNLTLNVVANTGHKVEEETKKKISSTLKAKYASGEITTYKQEHAWIKCYIYNIKTFKIEAECKNIADACRLLKDKHGHVTEGNLIRNRYIVSRIKFNNVNELRNYINEKILLAKSSYGKYAIIEDPKGNLQYFRTITDCARNAFSSKSTLSKHTDSTKENPYIIKSSGYKFYFSDTYIPVNYDAVPIEESSELSSSKIGESPIEGNTEVIEEIKESSTPYSIENETNK